MRTGKWKKAAGLVLTAALVLGGCGDSKGGDDGKDTLAAPQGIQGESIGGQNTSQGSTATSLVGEDGSWLGIGGCYKTAEPVWKETIQGTSAHGDDIFTYSVNPTDDNFSMTVSLGDDIYYESESVMGILCGAGGIWILDDTTDYTVSNRTWTLVLLGYDKQEKFRKDITQYIDGYFARGMREDAQGRLYMLMEKSVAVFSQAGEYQCSIPLEEEGKKIVLGGDGKVYVSVSASSQDGGATALTSTASGSSGEVLSVDAEAKTAQAVGVYDGYQLCDGTDGYLFTLVNEDGLYGVASVGGKEEAIAVWTELGMVFSNPARVQFLSGGRFLLEDQNMIVVLEPAEPSQIKPKTVLTMAGVSRFSPFTGLAAEFNMSNDEYIVKIVNYSKNEELSTKEAVDMLNLDIMSGKYPDLFDFLQLPETYYSDKGLLEDLYSYMEGDPEIVKEDFIALDKLEKDGKLYFVTDTFSLDTAAGLYSRFGDSYGWSLDKYLEIQSQYSGEVMYNITRDRFLQNMVYRYATGAVDWENGTCSFDNQEFIHLLDSVAKIRENPEPENSADLDFTPAGRRLKEETLIAAVWYIDNVAEMAAAEAEAGEKLSFIGWPTPDGSGGNILSSSRLAGICSKGNREGAWEFIKFILKKGMEEVPGWGLSTNRRVLEKQIEQAKEDYQSGRSKVPFDDEYAQRLYDLIDHCVYYGNASDKVVDIVMEEGAAFLAGAKTAEETAKVIQSRVGILVAE